jgi:pentatricopeptide repeat protein
MGNARQWHKALELIQQMKVAAVNGSGVEPNAYTYSALLKTMGDQGQVDLAEHLYRQVEGEALGQPVASARSPVATMSSTGSTSGPYPSPGTVDWSDHSTANSASAAGVTADSWGR